MENIVLLGGNILNGGIVKKRKKYGADRVVVFDWNEDPAVKGDIFIRCDIKDADSILKYLEMHDIDKIKFVYTSADLAVLTQRIIHQKYGLLALEEDIIAKTLQKSTMTKIWEEKGLLNRKTYLLDRWEKVNELDLKGEWILKPNLCSGSRGITILHDGNLNQYQEAYERAAEASWDNKVVIEQFVKGTEYTIEMLGDAYGNVAVCGISKKYHTIYNDKNKIAVKLHYNPLDVDEQALESIAEYGVQCYKALGLHTSLGHLEVMVTEDGRISPLEIGARSSGYIASHCLDAINTFSFLDEYAKIIRGGHIENGYVVNKEKSSMLYFYDMPEGHSVRGANITEFLPKSIESLAFDRTMIQKGMDYKVIDGDGERYGYEVLVGNRSDLTIENVENAEKEFIKYIYG